MGVNVERLTGEAIPATPAGGAAVRWAILAALGVGVAYYGGALVGMALTPHPQPVSTLWPPNALMLGVLLLTPTRLWPVLLAAALPPHLWVELREGVPLPMVMSWFVSNCSEALIGAGAIRWLIAGPVRFDRVRDVGITILFGAFAAPFLSSFLDSAFVVLNDWRSVGYWATWRERFFANVLSGLTVLPAILTWGTVRTRHLRAVSAWRVAEGAGVGVGLIVVCTLIFVLPEARLHTTPALLYSPLPFLFWAVVRFGPTGASACGLVLTLTTVWGAIHGGGPFVGRSMGDNVLALQLFLIVTFIPLWSLTAAIGALRTAEDHARRNSQELRLALSSSRMGTWEWDVVRDHANVTPELCAILGLPAGSLDGALGTFMEVIHRDDRSRAESAIAGALESRGAFEVEFRLASAEPSERWVQSKGMVVRSEGGRPVLMAGVVTDVTERRLAEVAVRNEIALRESEARLRELANAMPQIVWTANAEGRAEFFNHRWRELTGVTDAAGVTLDWFDAIHPLDRTGYVDAWRASVAAGQPFERESRFWSASYGGYRWHLTRALPMRDSSAAVVRWHGTATDIDDRKRAEQALVESEAQLRTLSAALERRVSERTWQLSDTNAALREEISVRRRAEAALRASEERLATAFRASLDAIAITRRADGRILEINDRWETMFGYSRSEAVGSTIEALGIYANQRDAQDFGSCATELGVVTEFELELRRKSGVALQAVLAGAAVQVGDEPCLIMMIRDITERRQAEHEIAVQRRALAQRSRITVLGELSGALAHELNQPLTAILANARAAQQMLRLATVDRPGVNEVLDDIVADGLRAGAVIQRVRGLIRSGDGRREQLTANDVITDVLDLAHNDLVQRGVTITAGLSPLVPAISADRVQLQQVLLNLIINACDAMADNQPSERNLQIVTAEEGGAVHLSVIDRGLGVTVDPIDSIFEPFVTSKQHGLGLGLSICRSIVSAHGGRIWAVNNPDRGATFHMVLPSARHATEAPVQSPVVSFPAYRP